MDILWAALLMLLVSLFWATNLINVPGNWLILLAVGLYAWLGPQDVRVAITWPLVAALAALAVAGELIELVAGAAGARRLGASKRGAALALVGSIIGGIAGLFVPVPLIASLVLACVGALVGAVLGEHWKGRALAETWEIGKAAFWGRLFGTLGKAMVGAVMVLVTLAGLVF